MCIYLCVEFHFIFIAQPNIDSVAFSILELADEQKELIKQTRTKLKGKQINLILKYVPLATAIQIIIQMIDGVFGLIELFKFAKVSSFFSWWKNQKDFARSFPAIIVGLFKDSSQAP